MYQIKAIEDFTLYFPCFDELMYYFLF